MAGISPLVPLSCVLLLAAATGGSAALTSKIVFNQTKTEYLLKRPPTN